MLYWQLTSQSNESHSSVNIRRISFHPKKRTRRSGSMEQLGDAMPLRFWYYPHEINLNRGTSSGEGISAASTPTWATQMNDAMLYSPTFLLGDGCNQLAHHLRSEANSSWQGAPSLEHRFYFSCYAAFWKKVADYTTQATSHFQDIGGI